MEPGRWHTLSPIARARQIRIPFDQLGSSVELETREPPTGLAFEPTGCPFLGACGGCASSWAILSFPVETFKRDQRAAMQKKKNLTKKFEYHIAHNLTWHSASHRRHLVADAAR
jgi:hypothetical protein